MELSDNRKYWGIWLTLTITLVVFVFFSLVQLAVAFFCIPEDSQIDITNVAYSNLGIISITSSIIGSCILFGFIKLKNTKIVDYLNLHMPKVNTLLIFLCGSFILMFVMEFISNLYPDLFETDFVIESYKQANSLPLLYIGVVFFGPIFEEFLFRGFLFKGLEKSFIGGHGAVFISSILFALVHIQYGLPILLFMLLPLSIFLGYARLKSGSLILPILIHIINNFLTCLITHFEVY